MRRLRPVAPFIQRARPLPRQMRSLQPFFLSFRTVLENSLRQLSMMLLLNRIGMRKLPTHAKLFPS